jgi:hypothetical protein
MTTWKTSVVYRVGEKVQVWGIVYECLIEHRSDVFATDLQGDTKKDGTPGKNYGGKWKRIYKPL